MIGWLGNMLLAICGIPLAYEAWKNKTIKINFWFLLVWTLGELLVLVHVIRLGDYPLILNYVANVLLLFIVWRYYDRSNDHTRDAGEG